MTGPMTGFVEKPPHVDTRRMRHIPDADLLAAFGAPSIAALRDHLAGRDVAPAMDPLRWARRAGPQARAATLAQAEKLLGKPVDFLDPAHGRSGLYGFHYLHWAQPLTRAYALTGDERYLAEFAAIVDAWYASRDSVKGEWPGLDVVWYTLGVAGRAQVFMEALHVFGTAMPEASWARMLKTVLGGARWLAEEHTAFRHGNWQLAGCSVLAQIAAFLPEAAESAGWARLAHRRLLEHLELDVYADGGHYERAPSYHTMCLGALQFAAIAGEQRLGWDLVAHPRFAAMHDWLLSITSPGGWVPPFNDSHLVRSAELLLRGHYLLERPHYKDAAVRGLPAGRIAEVLSWLPPRPGRGDPVEEFERAPSAAAPERSAWLAHSKFAVQRAAEGGLFAVVNCGPLIEHELETHSHRTVLDFVLAAFGRPLAWEAGGPDSYDDPAYQSWYRAGRAHNTVLLPGREMADEHDARVEHVLMSPVADVLAATHDGLGVRHRRQVVLVKPDAGTPGYWVITDEVAEEFEWTLNGLSPWRETPGGYRSSSAPGLVVLSPSTPVKARFTEGATTVPTTAGAEAGTLHGLSLTYRPGTVTHVLVPYAAEPPELTVEPGPVEAGAVEPGTVVRSGRSTVTLGDGCLVRADGGAISSAVLWSGTRIEYGGREVLAAVTGELRSAVLTRADGRTSAELTCASRTGVRLAAEPGSVVRLNDVVLPLTTADGWAHVVLPAAGTWSVHIESVHIESVDIERNS
ncbi:heparinase II/III family protein [Thermoactinospora rubra]|uniref:heparinase II/III family protein n=1 Tax=Thermoactinospora rubra TaxID=1088767 RepID=UPI001301C79C|nr:heparinase II/III family protein [Thermoactinospora rubra]